MIIKHYTSGSMSEAEGMTIGKNVFDDDGNLLTGTPENMIYKHKEITEEEYNTFRDKISQANKLGYAKGLVNDKGIAAIKKRIEDNNAFFMEINEPKIALSVKKIKKLLQLGIIEQGDIDVEIEQQGMSQFKDEIKRRLEQN